MLILLQYWFKYNFICLLQSLVNMRSCVVVYGWLLVRLGSPSLVQARYNSFHTSQYISPQQAVNTDIVPCDVKNGSVRWFVPSCSQLGLATLWERWMSSSVLVVVLRVKHGIAKHAFNNWILAFKSPQQIQMLQPFTLWCNFVYASAILRRSKKCSLPLLSYQQCQGSRDLSG